MIPEERTMVVHLLLIPIAAKAIASHYAATHGLAAAAVHHGGTAALLHPGGTAAAGHQSLAAALEHHAVILAAGKAGAVTGKALAVHGAATAATAGVHGAVGTAAATHVAQTYLLPVHIVPYHAVLDAKITKAAMAGATTLSVKGAAPATVLSPTVTQALRKFAKKFVQGYSVTRIKEETGGRVDVGTIRRWFRTQPQRDRIPVTATGTVSEGRFWASACPPDGPVDFIQGFYNPGTGTLSHARLLRDVEHLSTPVRHNHSESGLAFYLSGVTAGPLAA
jgi:hypothetical protein